jgi:hypothetical protein
MVCRHFASDIFISPPLPLIFHFADFHWYLFNRCHYYWLAIESADDFATPMIGFLSISFQIVE